MLNRDNILQAIDLKTEIVHVPEWGGDVTMRSLTGSERDAFEAESIEQQGKNQKVNLKNMRARLVARSLIGEDGQRLFSDGEILLLGNKNAVVIARLFEVAQRLSGLGAKDVEELQKN